MNGRREVNVDGPGHQGGLMEVPSEQNICGLLHSEKRAGGEGEAEGTGDREDVVLME